MLDLVKDGHLHVVQHLLLVRHRQPLDDVRQHALAILRARDGFTLVVHVAAELRQAGARVIDRDEARDNLIGYVLGRLIEHLLKLLGGEALDDNVLLLLSELVFFLELIEFGLQSLTVSSEAGPVRHLHIEALALDQVLELFVVEALEEALATLLHLDETRL